MRAELYGEWLWLPDLSGHSLPRHHCSRIWLRLLRLHDAAEPAIADHYHHRAHELYASPAAFWSHQLFERILDYSERHCQRHQRWHYRIRNWDRWDNGVAVQL